MGEVVLNILTVAFLLFGLFFMFIGALGLARFPDFFNRMHAASKPITLGISGMLIALVLHLASEGSVSTSPGGEQVEVASTIGTMTKATLVIMFQFVAAPVAAHLLARAAHVDKVRQWEGTLSDELQEDRDKADGPIV